MILSYLSLRQAVLSRSNPGTSWAQQEVPEDAEDGNVMRGDIEPGRSGLENSHAPLIRVT